MGAPLQRPEELIDHLCRQAGFALWGMARLEPTCWEAELREWVATGKHGSMTWLMDHLEARLDPNQVLDGARSVVMVADLYATREDAPDELDACEGAIARYARGRDYHKVIGTRLRRVCDELRTRFPAAQTRVFCDTAPVLERELASRCGLGWIGKHTLVIHPKLGSWMLLGGFLTTLELDAPETQQVHADHCGSCSRCIDACPTGAITPYSVDARSCISYVTIEHREAIEPSLSGKLNGWLFGCDICQEVCPHNSPRNRTHDSYPLVREDYTPRRRGFDLLEVLGWDEHQRREAFRTSALKRAKLAQFKRNAVCVLGAMLDEHRTHQHRLDEQQRKTIVYRLAEIAADACEDAMVREAAQRVLDENR